jgi:lipopolysaccharide export system protein LptA
MSNVVNSFITFPADTGAIDSGDWNVTNGGTDITINGDNIQLTGDNIKSGFYDVGEVISTSAWTLRFTLESSGSVTGNPIFWIGFFDTSTINSSSESGSGTTLDGISLMAYSGSNYLLSMKNNAYLDAGGSQTVTSPTVSANTTTRYAEIKRDGSNAILTFYDSDTYDTSIGTCTVSITGSGFRYLCAVSYFEGSGRTYQLTDVTFEDG